MGYARAVRVGPHVFISGTTALDPDGGVVAAGDAYGQARHILSIIASALAQAGAEMRHVVRTRMFVTDIAAHGEAVGKAHGEVFHTIKPASTMIEVSRLIDEALLVEIEAQALIT